MSREEIKNTPEIVDFMLDKSVIADSREKLRKRLEEVCNLAIKALEQEPCEDTGEISDGYHTFNQLYHQRAILFATIVNQNKDIAWKSYKHSDGKYCFDSNGEWFIVGIDTPEGSYTYHYSKEYWNYFKCKELDCGKEWDGHTEEDVTRLLSLKQEPCEDCISRQAAIDTIESWLTRDDYNEAERHIMRAMQSVLYDLPPVTPQPNRWIPFSEKLPEVGIDVLICDMEGVIYLPHRLSSNHYYDEWGNKIKDIRAWMPIPIPEPYKASPTGAEGSDKE